MWSGTFHVNSFYFDSIPGLTKFYSSFASHLNQLRRSLKLLALPCLVIFNLERKSLRLNNCVKSYFLFLLVAGLLFFDDLIFYFQVFKYSFVSSFLSSFLSYWYMGINIYFLLFQLGATVGNHVVLVCDVLLRPMTLM